VRTHTYTATASPVNSLAPWSIRTISARSIAKADWKPRRRALEAARWVAGHTLIKPVTATLASRVFGVSAQLISEALKQERGKHNGNGTAGSSILNQAWDQATPAERAALGHAVGVDAIWDAAVAPNLAP
jgi:hypothetical protein